MIYATRLTQDPKVSSAVSASALRNFNVGAFQMGFAISHELVHKWVNYLLGDPRSNTPPQVSYPGQSLSIHRGESGWNWESRFLGGGVLEFHHDPQDALPAHRQAGRVYHSRLDTQRRSWARPLDPAYIQRILNFGKLLLYLCPFSSFAANSPTADFTQNASAAPNAPPAVLRHNLPKPMDRIRIENMPAGIVFYEQSQVSVDELNEMNRKRTFSVSVSDSTIRPPAVLA